MHPVSSMQSANGQTCYSEEQQSMIASEAAVLRSKSSTCKALQGLDLQRLLRLQSTTNSDTASLLSRNHESETSERSSSSWLDGDTLPLVLPFIVLDNILIDNIQIDNIRK